MVSLSLFTHEFYLSIFFSVGARLSDIPLRKVSWSDMMENYIQFALSFVPILVPLALFTIDKGFCNKKASITCWILLRASLFVMCVLLELPES